jgi:hypothetical protein
VDYVTVVDAESVEASAQITAGFQVDGEDDVPGPSNPRPDDPDAPSGWE